MSMNFTKASGASCDCAPAQLQWFTYLDKHGSFGVMNTLLMLYADSGNVGNLPLVIVATLCDEKTSMFSRELGPRCGEIGIAYVAFSMWVAGFVQYSVAFNMMKLPPK